MPVRISAENFGPIGKGSITFEPLTVFIGPNNAGKSYFAMLTYAALNRSRAFRIFRSRGSFYPQLHGVPERELKRVRDDAAVYQEKVLMRSGATFPSPPESIVQITEMAAEHALARYTMDVAAELERAFGSKLRDISRRKTPGKSDFKVTIAHGEPAWKTELTAKRGQAASRILSRPKGRKLLQSALRVFFRPPSESERRSASRRVLEGGSPAEFLDALLDRAVSRCFLEFPRSQYYLPAARSGILQSHKALASFVVSRSSLAGIEDLDIPKMTGVISDFISSLLRLNPDRKARSASIARFLEEEVLEGAIRIRGESLVYPEISYETRGGRFPLHRTSSMVSELAPVILFLKYLVNPMDALIIEEPESHLHPDSQLKFARAIARLVNMRVPVVLTTHSDYFLSQLNNLITASKLTPTQRKKQEYDEAECLEATDVGAYLFRPQGGSKGTKVEQLETIDGISDSEFARVAELLYSQTVSLERRTMAK